MAQLAGVFSETKTPDGSPVFVTDMSTWSGNGFPDPISGMPLDPVMIPMQRKPETGEIEYWVGKSYLSGAFLRVFND